MVRMGQTPKGWSTRAKKLKQDKRLSKYEKIPHKSATAFQVGRVNPNLSSSVFSPILLQLADKSAERYATHLVYYQDEELKKVEAQENETMVEVEVDVNVDGEITEVETAANDTKKIIVEEMDMSDIDPTYNQKFHVFSTQANIQEFNNQVLLATAMDFSSIKNTYKARANVVKFERLLDEKYGFARPILTHPKVEPYVKLAQRKWATGQIAFTRQNDPPLSRTTSIILLFMMYRNGVRKDGIALAALYLLIGLQPWVLLLLAIFAVDRLEKRKRKKMPGMKESSIAQITSYYHEDKANRNEFLKTPVGTPLLTKEEEQSLDNEYNSILLGNGPSALYCAALLARVGRKVLVLSSSSDVSGEMTMNDSVNASDKSAPKTSLLSQSFSGSMKSDTLDDIPFVVTDARISHVERNQTLLAPALATDDDCQGGIRFATIGSEADGYAHDIFSIPGMGTGTIGSVSDESEPSATDTVPFVLRAGGIPALAEDTANFLGDGWQLNPEDISSSSAGTYVKTVSDLNKDAGSYFLSKVTDPKFNSWWDSKSQANHNEYRTVAARSASDFLSHYIPLNPHVRSLCAGIGMCMEDLPPSQCGMAAHVSNVSAFASGEGFSFPVGGMRALGKALENVIVKNGGKVVRNAPVIELLFEDKGETESTEEVKKKDEQKAKEDTKEDKKKKEKKIGPKCIGVKLASGTTLHVASVSSTSSSGDIEGSVISTHGFLDTFLRLTPDNIRHNGGVPAGLPALKERRPQLKLLLLLKGNREKLNLPSADWWRLPNASLARDVVNPETNQVTAGEIGEMSAASENSTIARKFTSGHSWMRVSFPSTKDPSWEERYGNVSTCVVTIEADDDFVKMFETKPKVYVLQRPNEDVAKRLVDRVMKDVLQEFPQLEGTSQLHKFLMSDWHESSRLSSHLTSVSL